METHEVSSGGCGLTGMCLVMLLCVSTSILILWASEETAGVLMGGGRHDFGVYGLPVTPEGSHRAWPSVEGTGSRAGSPDQIFSLVGDISLEA